jgi:Flp pilus assembly protein TadD
MELIDSKALVLINAGRFQEAHEMLDRLCRLNRKNPRYRLHLAIALHHLEEQDKSRGEVEQAVENGLSKELLTPSERREWRKIAGQVANR